MESWLSRVFRGRKHYSVDYQDSDKLTRVYSLRTGDLFVLTISSQVLLQKILKARRILQLGHCMGEVEIRNRIVLWVPHHIHNLTFKHKQEQTRVTFLHHKCGHVRGSSVVSLEPNTSISTSETYRCVRTLNCPKDQLQYSFPLFP